MSSAMLKPYRYFRHPCASPISPSCLSLLGRRIKRRKEVFRPQFAQVPTQQILLSIGALICLTPWALHIPIPFVLVLVNAVVVGKVLSAVMDYACPLNNRLTLHGF